MNETTPDSSSRRTLLYVPSYPTLVMALQCRPIRDLLVVTPRADIAGFCARLGIPTRCFPAPSDTSLRGLRAFREEIRGFAATVAIEDAVIGYHHCDLWGIYLMRELRPRVPVRFRNLDPIYRRCSPFVRPYWTPMRDRLVYFHLLRLWPEVFHQNARRQIFAVHPRRLERWFAPFTDAPSSDVLEANRRCVVQAFALSTYDLIYVDNVGHLPAVASRVRQILNGLRDNGWSITVKPHPRLTPEDAFPGFPVIDRAVPAELLFMNVRHAVLGAYSMSLGFLARYVKVVSLVKLLDLEAADAALERDEEDEIHDWVDGWSAQPLFPTSAEELETCLTMGSREAERACAGSPR